MKKCCQLILVSLALVACYAVSCKSNPAENRDGSNAYLEFVAEETLSTAEEKGVAYKKLVDKARMGDRGALGELLTFSRRVDAAAAIGHGIVLIGLLQECGDRVVAEIVQHQDPEVRQYVLLCLEAGLAYGIDGPRISPGQFAPLTCSACKL